MNDAYDWSLEHGGSEFSMVYGAGGAAGFEIVSYETVDALGNAISQSEWVLMEEFGRSWYSIDWLKPDESSFFPVLGSLSVGFKDLKKLLGKAAEG